MTFADSLLSIFCIFAELDETQTFCQVIGILKKFNIAFWPLVPPALYLKLVKLVRGS